MPENHETDKHAEKKSGLRVADGLNHTIIHNTQPNNNRHRANTARLRLTCWAAVVALGRVSPLAALQTGGGRRSVGDRRKVRLKGESKLTSPADMQNSLLSRFIYHSWKKYSVL